MAQKKLTATYEMTNIKTGTKHSYFVIRREKGYSKTDILNKFERHLNDFPAYKSGLFAVSSDIIVSDYKNTILYEIKVLH